LWHACLWNASLSARFPTTEAARQAAALRVGSQGTRPKPVADEVGALLAQPRQVRMEVRMGLMDALRNLFGAGKEPGGKAAEPVNYNGYRITPAPERQASGWNTAGVISKDFPDGVKEHKFIRVDTHTSKDDAVAFSITKAQQIIDEQGDRIFRSS
jgi:hypothetical protein